MEDKTENSRLCRNCKKPLLGRSDQVYCNDNCRNAFNKKKGREEKIPPHANQKEIFKIISRNYEILKKLGPHIYPGHIHTFKHQFVPKQFNRNFFTGSIQDKEGTWHLVFDRGWLDGDGIIRLKDFPESALLDD